MLKKIKDVNNKFKFGKKIKDESTYNKEYIDKRYKVLIRKGFSSKQAGDMILFELGSSAIVREGIEAATAEDCMMVGRLVGTEIGATIGSLGRSLQSFGTGSFIGGSLGVYFGKDACSKIIRYASEKVVQKTSEKLWTQYKDPLKEGIDTNYIAKHLTYNKTNNQKANDFKASLAIKNNETQVKSTLLKGGVTKNEYSQELENILGKRLFEEPDPYNQENHLETKAKFLEELKTPQNEKIQLIHNLVQKSEKSSAENDIEFDEKKDYSDYKNEVTKSNKIYTKEDLDKMSEEELKDNQKAIDYQKKSIGIPSKKQAAASGLVYVTGYTRSDGTEVKSYYRTRKA